MTENFVPTEEQESVNCRSYFNRVDSMDGKTDYLKLNIYNSIKWFSIFLMKFQFEE